MGRSGVVSAPNTLAEIGGLIFESSTGSVSKDPDSQHGTMNIVVAHGSTNDLQLVKRLGAIVPAPGSRIESPMQACVFWNRRLH